MCWNPARAAGQTQFLNRRSACSFSAFALRGRLSAGTRPSNLPSCGPKRLYCCQYIDCRRRRYVPCNRFVCRSGRRPARSNCAGVPVEIRVRISKGQTALKIVSRNCFDYWKKPHLKIDRSLRNPAPADQNCLNRPKILRSTIGRSLPPQTTPNFRISRQAARWGSL